MIMFNRRDQPHPSTYLQEWKRWKKFASNFRYSKLSKKWAKGITNKSSK